MDRTIHSPFPKCELDQLQRIGAAVCINIEPFGSDFELVALYTCIYSRGLFFIGLISLLGFPYQAHNKERIWA